MMNIYHQVILQSFIKEAVTSADICNFKFVSSLERRQHVLKHNLKKFNLFTFTFATQPAKIVMASTVDNGWLN